MRSLRDDAPAAGLRHGCTPVPVRLAQCGATHHASPGVEDSKCSLPDWPAIIAERISRTSERLDHEQKQLEEQNPRKKYMADINERSR